MEIDIPINGIKGEIHDEFLLIKSIKPLISISSAVLNGGVKEIKSIINYYVKKTYNHKDPIRDLKEIVSALNLKEEECAGFLTAVKMKNAVWKSKITDKFNMIVIITGGVSNSMTAGATQNKITQQPGTINIFVIIDGNLDISAHINTFSVITEAKVAGLIDLDIRGKTGGDIATGTSTDSILVACTGRGESIQYSGTSTDLGRSLCKLVRAMVKKSIMRYHECYSYRSLDLRLIERGISINDLINGILELFVPHPGIANKDKAKKWLEKEFKCIIKDPNVSALVDAGLRLEEDGIKGLIPTISAEIFQSDPIYLVADEILGIAIANYIAGTRGVLEFVRFDKKKPGILNKMGPVLDDILGGLMAGMSSLMYTHSLSHKGVSDVF
ncbi:MAG: phosphatidylglycerophosphatase A [Promethearchaeota archaeon]